MLYVKRGIEAAGFHWTRGSSREALFRHRSFVSVKARRKPAIGEIIQLDMMRKTFLAFIILIRRASPDPMIPEETVSVIDRGTQAGSPTQPSRILLAEKRKRSDSGG